MKQMHNYRNPFDELRKTIILQIKSSAEHYIICLTMIHL